MIAAIENQGTETTNVVETEESDGAQGHLATEAPDHLVVRWR